MTVTAGIQAIERHAAVIDRLNQASARPNPFLSAAFLYCYALRCEYHTPGREERLFLVWDGERAIGCVAMRRCVDTFGPSAGLLGVRGVRLGFLAHLDVEQPGMLCAPADEERVAAALIKHLSERETGWGMLEFAGQRPGSALHRAAHAIAAGRLRTRDIPVDPYNEIALEWPDLPAYFKSLSKKMRSNISRQVRRLFAAGEPALILAEGAASVSAWFEAYCDLDRRSWKHETASSIARHPRRLRFYRDIVAGRGGLDPSFIGVLLDGVLVAGLISGSNAGSTPHGTWCLEMAYDETRADLGPGQLLLLLAVGEALRRGDRFVNFLQMFAYYKHRWRAEPINVVNVQVLRRLSAHDIRGTLGELRRTLRRRGTASAAGDEDAAEPPSPAPPTRPVGDLARARALAAAACTRAGPGVRILDRTQARAYLPFTLDAPSGAAGA